MPDGILPLIVLLLLAGFVIIVLVRTVRIVPQQTALIIERLGRYSRTLEPGLHLLVPFVDVVRANIAALEKGDGGTYNIGTGVETSTRQVFEAVREAVGSGPDAEMLPERPGEVHNICLNVSRAKEELGWEPQVDFRQGVRQSVEWQKTQR